MSVFFSSKFIILLFIILNDTIIDYLILDQTKRNGIKKELYFKSYEFSNF